MTLNVIQVEKCLLSDFYKFRFITTRKSIRSHILNEFVSPTGVWVQRTYWDKETRHKKTL